MSAMSGKQETQTKAQPAPKSNVLVLRPRVGRSQEPHKSNPQKHENPKTGEDQAPSSFRSGFFDLPLEVRQLVYFIHLRPDCDRLREGYCTVEHRHVEAGDNRPSKLLTLCKQVYLEAKPYLPYQRMTLELGQRYTILRNSLECPMPNVFQGKRARASYYRPADFSELELRRTDMLTIDLDVVSDETAVSLSDDPESHFGSYCLWADHDLRYAYAVKVLFNIDQVIRVMQQSTDIKRFRLGLRTTESQTSLFDNQDRLEVWSCIETLIRTLVAKDVKLEIHINKPRHWRPGFAAGLHVWSLNGEHEASSQALVDLIKSLELKHHPTIPEQHYVPQDPSELEDGPWADAPQSQNTSNRRPDDSVAALTQLDAHLSDHEPRANDDWSIPDESWSENTLSPSPSPPVIDTGAQGEGNCGHYYGANFPLYRPEDMKHLDTLSPEQYVLAPECRHCMALFATQADLNEHLMKHRDHAVKWVQHEENLIYQIEKDGGSIGHQRRFICWTCGTQYRSHKRLKAHLKKQPGHRRFGLLPRYKKDNAVFDQRGKEFENQLIDLDTCDSTLLSTSSKDR